MKIFINKQILFKATGILGLICILILGLLRHRYIGRSFNSARDSNYVINRLWSYDGGFRIGPGDFLNFSEDSNGFNWKDDTIFYKSQEKARIVRINKRFFQLKVKSTESGEEGTYINVEERFQ